MRFLFDFLSPYAYLAWKRVHALAARHGREVEPVPVLLAALLAHHGHKGPAEIPGKRLYVFKNVLRLAAREGLPLSPPPAHPFNPVLAMRVASLDHPDQRRIIDALFDATWAGGAGVADAAAVQRALDSAGLDGAALVAAAGSAKAGGAKDRLRAQTDGAIAAGAFGVPTVLVDEELFWGFDAFADVDAFLSGADPVDPVALQRWAELPAAVVRAPPGGPHHGLSHLSLAVADLDRSVRFYAGLGYTPYFRDERSVQVVRAGLPDVIALELDPEQAGRPGGVQHFGFRLRAPESLDAVVGAALSAGGTLVRRGSFAPGCPYAYVKDPDGYTLEIWFE